MGTTLAIRIFLLSAGCLLRLILSCLGLVYRMKVEETLLTQQFGDEYRHSIKNTQRLIPRVW